MAIKLITSSEDITKVKDKREYALITFDDRLTLNESRKDTANIVFNPEAGYSPSFGALSRKMWETNQGQKFAPVARDSDLSNYLYQPRFRILFDHLLSRPLDATRFLDVGCCDANVAKKAIELGVQDVTAIDLPEIIQEIKPVDGLKLLAANLNEDFVDGEFDVIYAGEVIEHLYNDFAFLQRCYDHTAENGVLIITTPQDSPVKRWYEEGTHLRCYPDHTLAGLVACTGYDVERFNVQLNFTKNGLRTVAIVFARKASM
ncbi:MAG: class I SAM-dependent methyltransferase [Calditrichaeota bacterium]|nr:class I SAM-dependent methyltransferase [Calditrichota bacterium]